MTPISGSPESNLRVCVRCGLTYDWRRSASACLKMTYCGSLCERGDLGFTIDGLIASIPSPAVTLPIEAAPVEADRVPVAV